MPSLELRNHAGRSEEKKRRLEELAGQTEHESEGGRAACWCYLRRTAEGHRSEKHGIKQSAEMV